MTELRLLVDRARNLRRAYRRDAPRLREGSRHRRYSRQRLRPAHAHRCGVQVGSWQEVAHVDAGLLERRAGRGLRQRRDDARNVRIHLPQWNDSTPTRTCSRSEHIGNQPTAPRPSPRHRRHTPMPASPATTRSSTQSPTATAEPERDRQRRGYAERPAPPPPATSPAGHGNLVGRIFARNQRQRHSRRNEIGLRTSVQVYLLDSNNNVVASTWTTAGLYSFNGVNDGQISRAGRACRRATSSRRNIRDRTSSWTADVDSNGYSSWFSVNGFTFFEFECRHPLELSPRRKTERESRPRQDPRAFFVPFVTHRKNLCIARTRTAKDDSHNIFAARTSFAGTFHAEFQGFRVPSCEARSHQEPESRRHQSRVSEV